jgi:hypothetical protein
MSRVSTSTILVATVFSHHTEIHARPFRVSVTAISAMWMETCFSETMVSTRSPHGVVDCILFVVMGRDCLLSTAALGLLYYPRMIAMWTSE